MGPLPPTPPERGVPSPYVALPAVGDLGARFGFLRGQVVHFVAWPSSNGLALCANPDVEYVFYALGERVLVLAKELLPRVLSELAPTELKVRRVALAAQSIEAAVLAHPERILGYALGEELEHLGYRHPESPRSGHVTLSALVTLEEGTGLLLAPAG